MSNHQGEGQTMDNELLTQIFRDAFCSEGFHFEDVSATFSDRVPTPKIEWSRNGANSWIKLRLCWAFADAPEEVIRDAARLLAGALVGNHYERKQTTTDWLDAKRHKWQESE